MIHWSGSTTYWQAYRHCSLASKWFFLCAPYHSISILCSRKHWDWISRLRWPISFDQNHAMCRQCLGFDRVRSVRHCQKNRASVTLVSTFWRNNSFTLAYSKQVGYCFPIYLTQAAWPSPCSSNRGCSDRILKINEQVGRTGDPKQTILFCNSINLNKIKVLCRHLHA